MAEVWRKPTKFDEKKLKEAFNDNIIFSLVYSSCQALESSQNEKFDEFLWRKWYSITRLFLKNYSPLLVHNAVFKVTEELAESNWTGFSENNFYKTNKKFFGINTTIPITEIAKKLGLNVKGNKCVCPFHNDGQASLMFYPKTNSFFCFGCRIGGNALKFFKLYKELYSEDKWKKI